MSQTLRTTFNFEPHTPARRSMLPACYSAGFQSLDGLLMSMQQFLARAKTDLLQPRSQVIDRILREAALMR